MLPPDERRQHLRRLDDILELLEQMNLNEQTRISEALATRLEELGVEEPRRYTPAQLIEKVWSYQQPFLITLTTDRRRRRRRKTDVDLAAPTVG
jgi:hypothetical protein